MFFDNREIMMYKVIGELIYTIIDNHVPLNYMGMLQYKLSKHDNQFEKPSSTSCQGWEYLRLL